MEDWKTAVSHWRTRAKDWKDNHTEMDDADIAAAITEIRWERYPDRVKTKNNVERATVNSWLNKRDPNVEDFMEMCEVMKADPRYILFGDYGAGRVKARTASAKKRLAKGRTAKV